MSTDLAWHKSSYSNQTGGHCVEVAESAHTVLVRDTQNRDLGPIGVSTGAWGTFLAEVKTGHL
ncbi:DUF397 domain-containing protein [Nocardiopsis ansamitocini]|uniref:DUF397 domain-containing protein n=1 Tax=Nocardiopsis ansamitocini TaxID=1670832 RepID=A0A9W6PB45_9ACTN|nr:DUF397 domain-containing protein [Nocardiopsis ansamitocini]GLU50288.1 hypothetical protein Nans01_46390 [Nocardiopsis ansamitocini]